MLFNHPQPEPEMLQKVYEDVRDPTYVRESEARRKTFHRSLAQLHRYSKPPGCLLDVGCYTGVFLQVAFEAGWTTEGVEPSVWASGIARERGIGEIRTATLEECSIADGVFDAVTLWDVIEHLSDPGAMLRNVHRFLKPGGIVAFSTHTVDSVAVRVLGTRYPFFMDMHLVHFSRKTIRRLLEQEGYEVLDIRPHLRVLSTKYLLERIRHNIPISAAQALVARLESVSWIAERFIAIGGLGLVNVFARKKG